MKGKRAVEWRLVDAVYPASRFKDAVKARALELAAQSDRPSSGPGVTLNPVGGVESPSGIEYSSVSLGIDRAKRVATLTVRAPKTSVESTPGAILKAGDQFWPFRVFREIDDAILRLRVNEPEVGTVVIKAEGDAQLVLEADAVLHANRNDWFVREVIHFIKRTLKRIDLSARSFFAIVEPGNAFAGTRHRTGARGGSTVPAR